LKEKNEILKKEKAELKEKLENLKIATCGKFEKEQMKQETDVKADTNG